MHLSPSPPYRKACGNLAKKEFISLLHPEITSSQFRKILPLSQYVMSKFVLGNIPPVSIVNDKSAQTPWLTLQRDPESRFSHDSPYYPPPLWEQYS